MCSDGFDLVASLLFSSTTGVGTAKTRDERKISEGRWKIIFAGINIVVRSLKTNLC